MGAVSAALGNFGAAHEIEYNGKAFRLSLVDQRVKSAFEKARFQKAKEPINLLKDDLAPEEYSRRLQEKIDLYEAGEYEIFSENSVAFLKTLPGIRLLLSLIVDCDPNELMGLVLAKKDELIPMVGLILRESFPGLQFQEAKKQEQAIVDSAKKAIDELKEMVTGEDAASDPNA